MQRAAARAVGSDGLELSPRRRNAFGRRLVHQTASETVAPRRGAGKTERLEGHRAPLLSRRARFRREGGGKRSCLGRFAPIRGDFALFGHVDGMFSPSSRSLARAVPSDARAPRDGAARAALPAPPARTIQTPPRRGARRAVRARVPIFVEDTVHFVLATPPGRRGGGAPVPKRPPERPRRAHRPLVKDKLGPDRDRPRQSGSASALIGYTLAHVVRLRSYISAASEAHGKCSARRVPAPAAARRAPRPRGRRRGMRLLQARDRGRSSGMYRPSF